MRSYNNTSSGSLSSTLCSLLYFILATEYEANLLLSLFQMENESGGPWHCGPAFWKCSLHSGLHPAALSKLNDPLLPLEGKQHATATQWVTGLKTQKSRVYISPMYPPQHSGRVLPIGVYQLMDGNVDSWTDSLVLLPCVRVSDSRTRTHFQVIGLVPSNGKSGCSELRKTSWILAQGEESTLRMGPPSHFPPVK